ncbi:MAG: hypothetical protein R2752_05700 [Vicinamibacterales bacterium]
MRLSLPGAASVLAAVVLGAAGCAPFYQDARLLQPGRFEVSPSVSGAGVTADGDSEYVVTTVGVQAQVGVAERLNLGAAYGRIELDDGGGGVNGFAFGPRIGVVRDRVAITAPFSFLFGEDVNVRESWAFHPGVVVTTPVGRRVDLNWSGRLLVPLCEGCPDDFLVAFGIGAGVHTGSTLVLRPEVAFLFDPGESGFVWTFGFGVSARNR